MRQPLILYAMLLAALILPACGDAREQEPPCSTHADCAAGEVCQEAECSQPHALAAGGEHTCVIQAERTVQCWGANNAGQSTPPAEADFLALTAGGRHTCGILADSTALCWGANDAGQSTPPDERWRDLSAFGQTTCGVTRSNALRCWGDDSFGKTSPPEGSFAAVTVGRDHACALTQDRRAVCWGSSADQRLDAPDEPLAWISAGGSHTCALTLDGAVRCWGASSYGQLDTPGGSFVGLEAGSLNTCAVSGAGNSVCWGDNTYGQSPLSSRGYEGTLALDPASNHLCAQGVDNRMHCSYRAQLPDGPISSLSLLLDSSCAVRTDQSLACFFPEGSLLHSIPVPSGRFTRVQIIEELACALQTDSTLRCWSNPDFVEPPEPAPYLDFDLGYGVGCGVKTDGALSCWYWWRQPFSLPSGTFKRVSLASEYACALNDAGELVCWGLGAAQPRDYRMLEGPFVELEAGELGVCALRADGEVRCASTSRAEPPDWASTLKGHKFSTLVSVYYLMCGITTEGILVCAGEPGAVPPLLPREPLRAISAGNRHACGLTPTDELRCWGANEQGQAPRQPEDL